MAEQIAFWVLATVAVAGAIGVVAAAKAVYSALFLAGTMISLALLYVAQGALFLGVVQVVVYTGAVMMLFLFVLMLIGVDSVESLTETLRGQRLASILAGLGFGILLIAGIGSATAGGPVITAEPSLQGAAAELAARGNVEGLAVLIFIKYVWAFEVAGALLIIAAMGAMVLAHRERLTPRKTQRELSVERFGPDGHPTPLPNPGVFARSNGVDVAALLPDGSPAALSVNATLIARDGAEDPR